jgi:preprotein translocase subunit SecG
MEILRFILIVVEVLCCLLLIGVILLQQSKSQGMGLAFGGGMSESLFGSRAGNVLTKITVILALVFLANTTILGIMYTSGGGERSLVESAPAPAPVQAAPSGPLTPAPQEQPQMLTVDESMPVAQPIALSAEPVEIAAEPVVMEVETGAPVEISAEPEMVPVEAEPAPAN